MSIFGKILKTGFDIVTTPIDVVKDVASMGGVLTDQRESYTTQKLKRLHNDAEEIRDELDDL
jgi:hypothetical protein